MATPTHTQPMLCETTPEILRRVKMAIAVSADDVLQLRRCDVFRVLDQAYQASALEACCLYIKQERPDLCKHVDAALADLEIEIQPPDGILQKIDEAKANAAIPDLLAAFDVVPIPPADFDTDDGCRAYADAIMLWLDTTCTAAIDLFTLLPGAMHRPAVELSVWV